MLSSSSAFSILLILMTEAFPAIVDVSIGDEKKVDVALVFAIVDAFAVNFAVEGISANDSAVLLSSSTSQARK